MRRSKGWGRQFEFYLFERRVIATIDPHNVQFALATEFEKFGVGPARERATVPMMGRGIICADGKIWREGRDLIMPTFTRSQIADRDVFEKHV
jgi:cytochrome P450